MDSFLMDRATLDAHASVWGSRASRYGWTCTG
ncbi:MAG: hypothetical protein Q8R56_15330 [Polaromonas sp.]|nr:hypothetical protein [Polaromonas sp.]